MLKIVNLFSGYGEMKVLHGVDLEINSSEIVALIGPNGAGKSTILRSIFGLTDITGGKIIYKNKDITNLKTHKLINLGIGFVPQGRRIFQDMTVLENLQIGAFTSKNMNEVVKNVNDIFQRFPVLKERQNVFARNLSGGQQQLLAIARALMRKLQILILDEPSLGLMPKAVKEIFKEITKIKNEGVAVLMVEQNAKQAVGIADRTYILENGKILMQGNKDILHNKKIQDIFLGGDFEI
jgi:branched-chain amino acid transport system ATP-binding protein